MSLRNLMIFVVILCFSIFAQHANDTLLFSVTLNDDTASIYGCQWNERISSTLSGPVMMEGGNLLFYSQNGYVLYNQRGKLLDSHSLFKMNRKALKDNGPLVQLAYPLDSTRIIYFKQNRGKGIEIFQKQIMKGDLQKVNETMYASFKDIGANQLFNIASNSITDEMSKKSYLMDFLVGFTSIDSTGIKWWTTDKFYGFTSPLIIEQNQKFKGFFSGLKMDQQCPVKVHLIEPLGAFCNDGNWYYYGLYTPMGNTDDEYYQTLVLCDAAGNLLYTNELLKQEITDAALQKVDKINTVFTVRKAVRHVFVPVVDQFGDIFYGQIDYERRIIDVYKRMFYRYVNEPGSAVYPDSFSRESHYLYNPAPLECGPIAKRGVFPDIAFISDKGMEVLDPEQLTIDGYAIKVHRNTDEELKKKLARVQHTLPAYVQHIQDSIKSLPTFWCPYAISLNNDSGQISLLHYGLTEVVQAARILAITPDSLVIARVDLQNRAEIVVMTLLGKYLNRFTFNKQNYNDRKDLVVVNSLGEMFEKDFESGKKEGRFFHWKLRTASIIQKR